MQIKLSDKKIVWGLLLLQLVVCLPFLTSFPIALDEPFSIFYAQQDLKEFIPVINDGNNSPFYFIILHFWIKLFGISTLAVRLLSVLISLATIYCLYNLARRSLTINLSVLTVLFFIFSRFFHYHAMEARMYMLFSLFFILIVRELIEVRTEKPNNVVLLVIWNVLLFYTHYLAIFVFITEVAFVLFYFKKFRANIKPLLIGVGAIILLCIPGGIVLFERVFESTGFTTWVPKPEITELYGNILRLFNNTLTFLLVFIGVLILFITLKVNRNYFFEKLLKDDFFKGYLLLFLVPYVFMFVYSLFYQSVFLDRYILFTGILLFLCLTHLISHFFQSNHNTGFALLIVVPMVFSVRYAPRTNRDVNDIALILKTKPYTEATIYMSPPWLFNTILYHYDQAIFKNYSLIDRYEGLIPIYSLEEIDHTDKIAILNSIEGYISDQDLKAYFEKKSYIQKDRREFNEIYTLNLFEKDD